MSLIWSTSGLDSDRSTKPTTWLFDPGDWTAVEEALGTSLPNDFKNLIGDGIACVFGDELMILSPFDPNPNCNLLNAGAEIMWAIAYLRRQGWPTHAVSLYPEPGGLLPWGRDDNGAQYMWDTSRGNPDIWTVVVDGRPVDPPMQRHAVGLAAYLSGLRSGVIRAAAYSDWPDADANVKRRDE